MKTRFFKITLCLSLSAALAAPSIVAAQIAEQSVAATTTPATPTVGPSTPATNQAVAVQLPRGAEDVLKLSRAQLSEDIILGFVRNSRAAYYLSAESILCLHKEGVSDRVISAMLEQQPKAMATTAQPASPAAPSSFVSQASSPAASAPSYVQPAPSTVYVAPAVPATYYYYQPYYSPA
jgi:hypothetical protein